MANEIKHRQLGQTDIRVSPVAMGCWPITGMTSLDVNEQDSLATLQTAVDCGINFFDTAYCYGADGESEKLIARALGQRRDEILIATKGGIHWDEDRKQQLDGRPATLKRELDESLRRLQTDRVELLYLHAPDPKIPLADSAGALKEIMDSGKARSIGVSNFSVDQLREFHAICPITANQPPYNMLLRQIEETALPWCRENSVSSVIYWPLMKGLLAGKLLRDHVFDSRDGRAKYAAFQGDEWQKNQDFVDQLRTIAADTNMTVAQLVTVWTIQQPGITAALCGAKRSYQIEETAKAMTLKLTPDQLQQIDVALAARGTPVAVRAV